MRCKGPRLAQCSNIVAISRWNMFAEAELPLQTPSQTPARLSRRCPQGGRAAVERTAGGFAPSKTKKKTKTKRSFSLSLSLSLRASVEPVVPHVHFTLRADRVQDSPDFLPLKLTTLPFAVLNPPSLPLLFLTLHKTSFLQLFVSWHKIQVFRNWRLLTCSPSFNPPHHNNKSAKKKKETKNF